MNSQDVSHIFITLISDPKLWSTRWISVGRIIKPDPDREWKKLAMVALGRIQWKSPCSIRTQMEKLKEKKHIYNGTVNKTVVKPYTFNPDVD